MGSLFNSPDPSPPPPPPPTPATVANPQTKMAGSAGQANARQGGAMSGTLLTSASGTQGGSSTTGKKLMGD